MKKEKLPERAAFLFLKPAEPDLKPDSAKNKYYLTTLNLRVS